MTPGELEQLFKPLLGYGWQRKLSKLALLGENTISRYKNGSRTITPDKEKYFVFLAESLIKHGDDIIGRRMYVKSVEVVYQNDLRPLGELGALSAVGPLDLDKLLGGKIGS